MVFAHVIYKKTGQERKNVTLKAYNLIKNQYTLLGYVDENGNPVAAPSQQQVVQNGKTQKKSAAPVVVEAKRKMTPEEIEDKKAELKAMNDASIQKAKEEQEAKEAEKKSKQKASA